MLIVPIFCGTSGAIGGYFTATAQATATSTVPLADKKRAVSIARELTSAFQIRERFVPSSYSWRSVVDAKRHVQCAKGSNKEG